MIEARGYEDLAYLVMREDLQKNPGRFYSAADIVGAAEMLGIGISISTKWETGSEEFRRCLASCLRRAAAVDDQANEDLVCIFRSESKASAGPWTLVASPRNGEDYFSYRHRVRGTSSRPMSGLRPSHAGGAGAEPSAWNLGEFRGKIAAGHPAGHPSLDVSLFDRGAIYSEKDGVPHRADGPAVIDWASGIMYYTSRGVRHRLDGPALLTPERDDAYYIDGEEVGDAAAIARSRLGGAKDHAGQDDAGEDDGDDGEEPAGSRIMRRLISDYQTYTGGTMAMDQRLALKKGHYKDYGTHEPELLRLRAYFDDMMAEQDEG